MLKQAANSFIFDAISNTAQSKYNAPIFKTTIDTPNNLFLQTQYCLGNKSYIYVTIIP